MIRMTIVIRICYNWSVLLLMIILLFSIFVDHIFDYHYIVKIYCHLVSLNTSKIKLSRWKITEGYVIKKNIDPRSSLKENHKNEDLSSISNFYLKNRFKRISFMRSYFTSRHTISLVWSSYKKNQFKSIYLISDVSIFVSRWKKITTEVQMIFQNENKDPILDMIRKKIKKTKDDFRVITLDYWFYHPEKGIIRDIDQ